MSSAHQNVSQRLWYALDVDIEPKAREAVEYALMEAGSLGTETNEAEEQASKVIAYFNDLPNRAAVHAELADALRLYNLPSSSVRGLKIREFADEDWMGQWKKSWQPVETGRFIVAPPWTNIEDTHDRIVIHIEPGMAFGTGTHETTRLCLAAIEKYFRGSSFLDLGTGTGILAIAAAKLFPDACIEAYDTDPAAIAIARENARLNDVEEQISFRVGSLDQTTASADIVCANLTADVIASLLPALLSVTCGHLILSGILNTQAETVRARLLEFGVTAPFETIEEGEWVAMVI
ncbi:MAG: 50S ribosomal protein L11 methyltransferase [Pyrinomonadaceae bacterium]